jgi:hypothetical protein
MAKSTRKLSESEREQRRARDRERLQQAGKQLLSSDGWERWVRQSARQRVSGCRGPDPRATASPARVLERDPRLKAGTARVSAQSSTSRPPVS